VGSARRPEESRCALNKLALEVKSVLRRLLSLRRVDEADKPPDDAGERPADRGLGKGRLGVVRVERGAEVKKRDNLFK